MVDKLKKLVDKSIKLVDKQSKVLDKSQNCSSKFMTIKIKVTDRMSEKEFFTKMFEKATHCVHLHMMSGDLTKV
ncbi:hypothetical protein ABNX05_12685 [Lysinibacillus sp. M3]|uniref:Uncharacterized protein n=1 Tax=Lysinibacillus zambalensis TaxID=3160866 RepID=A0ABV1MU95_9BACI